MLIVACVESGNYLGRGVEYVSKLRASVKRHLPIKHQFIVLTESVSRHWREHVEHGIDIAELPLIGAAGWWNKIALFQSRMFAPGDRIVYIDLDSVIVGDLSLLVETKGIIHLDQWGWEKKVYGSGTMVWDAGEHREIWERFTPRVAMRLRGDQDWMTELGGWEALNSTQLRSYRYHCKKGIPPGCSIVAFHGEPKPHEALDVPWVKENWKE